MTSAAALSSVKVFLTIQTSPCWTHSLPSGRDSSEILLEKWLVRTAFDGMEPEMPPMVPPTRLSVGLGTGLLSLMLMVPLTVGAS